MTLSTTLLHSLPSSPSPSPSPSSPSSPQLPLIERIPPLALHYRSPSAPSSKSSTPSPQPIASGPQRSLHPIRIHTLADHSQQHSAAVATSSSPATASAMVTAVSPLRTGITRSTRPPMLPLTKSSLSTFIQEPQLLPALSTPKHHSPCTPPARTPHRHSHDGSTRERHHPFLARRSSASTFGGGEAREDGSIDTPPPPSPVSVSDRKAPSAASLPSTPAETQRRTAPPPGAGAAHVDHLVPVRSLSLALPLKAPPSVGTPLLVDVAERPEDERPAAMINSQMDRAHNQEGRRRGSKRGTESVELKIALDLTVNCESFEASLLGPEDTNFQAFPARTGFKVPFTPVDIPGPRRDERTGEASESHRHGRSLDLDAVTERNIMANARGLGTRTGPADAYKRHSHHLSLSSVTSIDVSGGRHSVGDSESVTSATGLLPAVAIRVPSRSRPPPLELNLVPAPTAPCELSRLPPSLGSRSDLSPGRKAQLVRRTRKLERVLGEPLHEKHVEQYVVEPSLSTTTVMTKLEEGVWPDTPTGGLPEWARADVVPRCESRTEEVDEEPPSASRRLAHQRSRSGLALSRMRSLMGRDTPPPVKIVVNLTREVRTIETQVRSSPMIRHSANRDDQQPPTPETPRSIMTVSTIETHEEASRRQRRQQLSKLQRLLGVHIPPHALYPREDDLVPRCTPQGRSASESSLSLQSGVSHISSSETGRARLAARLLRTVHAGPRMSTTEPLQPAFNDADTMSRAEKAVARKRASKLEQMFGRVPPQDMFLPVRGRASVDLEGLRKCVAGDNSDAASPTSAHAYATALAALSGSPPSRPVRSTVVDVPVASTDLVPSAAFTSYRDSIRSLIWLVENDQGRLASIVDEIAELEEAAPPNRRSSLSSIDFGRATVEATRARSPRSPRSPMALIQSIGRATGLVAEPLSPTTPEVSAHTVARRRTRKLSAFFGERVDPAHAHVMHHHHAHMHSLPSAHPPHTHAPAMASSFQAPAIPSSFHAVPGNYTARHSRPPSAMHNPRTSVFGFAALAEPSGIPRTAARRRETFDGVLGELWRNVQAEAAQGRMRSTEFGNLREMWSRLGRQRAQSGAWAEL